MWTEWHVIIAYGVGMLLGTIVGFAFCRLYSPPYVCPGSACWKKEYEKLREKAESFGLPIDN
jgi:hypothetical protein